MPKKSQSPKLPPLPKKARKLIKEWKKIKDKK